MEYIIQKNVELGVKKIIPVEMERSIVKFDQKTVEKKIERWQKISEVASKAKWQRYNSKNRNPNKH